MLSRLENEVLGNEAGLKVLDGALRRSVDALLRKKDKRRLIIDVDSTEDPAHGGQERVAYNGHFGLSCFHPLFAFTSEGACLGAKLRPLAIRRERGSARIGERTRGEMYASQPFNAMIRVIQRSFEKCRL